VAEAVTITRDEIRVTITGDMTFDFNHNLCRFPNNIDSPAVAHLDLEHARLPCTIVGAAAAT
jgi:hypothetical protein